MSAFLDKADYAALIETQILDQLTGSDDALLDETENYAQSQMINYLGTRFNTTLIFAATGGDRDAMIKMFMIDIVLYHLSARISAGDISEARQERYDRALEWLKMAREGDLETGLPIKTDADDENINRIRYGSNEKMNHQF